MPKRAVSETDWNATIRGLQADYTTARVHLFQAMSVLYDAQQRTVRVDSSFWRRADCSIEQISHAWADLGRVVNDIGEATPDD